MMVEKNPLSVHESAVDDLYLLRWAVGSQESLDVTDAVNVEAVHALFEHMLRTRPVRCLWSQRDHAEDVHRLQGGVG